jgi:hypothetical protein
MHVVPQSVKNVVTRALALNAEKPLSGVTGDRTAKALLEGSVTTSVLIRMLRYGKVNTRTNTILERDLFRTVDECKELRSYDMRGGNLGFSWAQKEESGEITPDPVLELFDLKPEEVYPRFALGAWRFTYDLTPKKAVRFLEDYTEATGNWLDIARAFGDSAAYVSKAVFEKYIPKRRTYIF